MAALGVDTARWSEAVQLAVDAGQLATEGAGSLARYFAVAGAQPASWEGAKQLGRSSRRTKLPVRELDGANFDTLDGFYDEVERSLIAGVPWGRNLDAFNDILRGGFGTPARGFVLRWVNSERSRIALGMPETIGFLERKLQRCHPSNVASVQADLDAACRGDGQTLFDILVDVIQNHGVGGEEAEDRVELELDGA